MKKLWIISISLLAVSLFVTAGLTNPAKGKTGKELFEQHCVVCHPNGDNIINPQFTLHKKDLDAHGVKKPADIIAKMRNPGPGMTQFDKGTIPDRDAKKMADYILKTFKQAPSTGRKR
jgi:cytochrome c6